MQHPAVRLPVFSALVLLMLFGALGSLNAEDNHIVINGTVADRAGKALPGVTVKAYEKTLRIYALLAGAKTDKRGYFEIAFQSEKTNPPIVVKVFGLKNELLHTSPVHYSVTGLTDIKIVIKNAETFRKIPK